MAVSDAFYKQILTLGVLINHLRLLQEPQGSEHFYKETTPTSMDLVIESPATSSTVIFTNI